MQLTGNVKCTTVMERSDHITNLMSKWPESWQGGEADLGKANEIVSVFSRFLEFLVENGFTQRTIRRHVDNLWLLGGEIIRDINMYPEKRRKTAFDLLDSSVDEEGGPQSRHLRSENEKKSFDATCKKLHVFFKTQRRHLTTRSSSPSCLSRRLRGKHRTKRPAAERHC